MKKFAWQLQKVLDVAIQKEQVLEAQLAAQAAEIRRLNAECDRRRASLAMQLTELGAEPLDRRLGKQDVFMRFSVNEEREIRKLAQKAAEIEQERKRTIAAFLKVRSSRLTLENLRERDMARYIKECNQKQQKKLDDIAQAGYARRKLQSERAYCPAPGESSEVLR